MFGRGKKEIGGAVTPGKYSVNNQVAKKFLALDDVTLGHLACLKPIIEGNLDAIATEQIKNSLDAIKAGRTVIIISHSLSQILDSDKIYVMKKGEVVESGTHDELINMNGTYREIFDASARSLNLDKLVSSYREN